MSAESEEPHCPRCGGALSTTVTTPQPGDQLAPDRVECASCGALLERAVQGHADHGWRIAEREGDEQRDSG